MNRQKRAVITPSQLRDITSKVGVGETEDILPADDQIPDGIEHTIAYELASDLVHRRPLSSSAGSMALRTEFESHTDEVAKLVEAIIGLENVSGKRKLGGLALVLNDMFELANNAH